MEAKAECVKYFKNKLDAGGPSAEHWGKEEDVDEPFPFSPEEVAEIMETDDYEYVLRVAKTIDICRCVADEFYYGPDGPKGLAPGPAKRMDYISSIFNSMMGWNKEKIRWWLQNIPACGAPDDASTARNFVHLIDMDKPSEVEAYVRRGLGVKECWGCGKGYEEKVKSICSRCKEARYCSTACQRGDYAYHKRYCTPRTKDDMRLRP